MTRYHAPPHPLGLLSLLLVAACGRISYDSVEHDGAILDASTTLDSAIIDAAPALPVVVDTGGFPFAIATDGSDVYWTDFSSGSLHRLSSAGGPSVELIPPRLSAGVYGLAIAGGFAYLCDSASGEIWKVATTGGPSEIIATTSCRDLAANDTHLYWTNSDALEPSIRRLSLPSGLPEDFDLAGPSTNLRLAGDHVYWTSYGTGEVFKRPISGLVSATNLLTTVTSGGPWGLTVDTSHVYFAEHRSSQGSISRVPLGGGPAEVLVANQEGAHEVVLDGSDLYWTSEFAGTITRLSPGGIAEVIATGQDQPLGIAVTSDSIWWTSRGGTVTRMGK